MRRKGSYIDRVSRSSALANDRPPTVIGASSLSRPTNPIFELRPIMGSQATTALYVALSVGRVDSRAEGGSAPFDMRCSFLEHYGQD